MATATSKLAVMPRPQRPQLVPPIGVSKSMAKAMSCPSFFTGQYMQPDSVSTVEHFLTRTGIEFAAWREAYLNHLIDEQLPADPAFKADYLARVAVSDDARTVIERDDFLVNPEQIYGAEVFLSADRDFRPLENSCGGRPGRLSTNTDTLASGTTDLLLIQGRVATVRDQKSGYSTVGVTDDEPVVYGVLVFAHFPMVDEVHFVWDFVRKGLERPVVYRRREDLQWMQDRVRQLDQKKHDLINRYNRGEQMEANAFSGNCPYCQVDCPLRPAWEGGRLAIGPPQTREDAIRLAQFVKVCEDGASAGREVLKTWLDQEPSGQLDIGAGWYAAPKTYETCEYPLVETLKVLGLALVSTEQMSAADEAALREAQPFKTPKWDVPLSALVASNLSGFIKAKKRAGLKDELDQHAKRSASTRVQIKKIQAAEEDDLVPLLKASLKGL